MKTIIVNGRSTLNGEVTVQGSKNAVLPILAATLLTEGTTTLTHCPNISDVECMICMLQECGVKVSKNNDEIQVEVAQKELKSIPEDLFTRMRSSVYFLGALCGRKETIEIPSPGGCVIGKRPIDAHIKTLQLAGVQFRGDSKCVVANPQKIHSCDVTMPIVSVGATQNMILAMVRQEGISIIRNAACEPEVVWLCHYLNQCGAKIYGAGSRTIWIDGANRLIGCRYHIPADRIVSGTYLIATAVTRGYVRLLDTSLSELGIVANILEKMGARLKEENQTVLIDALSVERKPAFLCTDVYPGFPTDLQSAMIVLEVSIDGIGTIEENIFEDRFHVVPELVKMGAVVRVDGNKVVTNGVEVLHGASVRGTELRGTAALVIAALMADSVTKIEGYEYLHRGYECMIDDLNKLGAKICLEERNENESPQS